MHQYLWENVHLLFVPEDLQHTGTYWTAGSWIEGQRSVLITVQSWHTNTVCMSYIHTCCLTHQVEWQAGSPEWTGVGRGWDYMQSRGPGRTWPPQPGSGPRSPQLPGQKRPHTPCCRSHRCGRKLAAASYMHPGNINIIFFYFTLLFPFSLLTLLLHSLT